MDNSKRSLKFLQNEEVLRIACKLSDIAASDLPEQDLNDFELRLAWAVSNDVASTITTDLFDGNQLQDFLQKKGLPENLIKDSEDMRNFLFQLMSLAAWISSEAMIVSNLLTIEEIEVWQLPEKDNDDNS